MNLIRRSAWAVVVLGAVAGCSGDEETPATGTNPTPAANPSMAPKTPVVPAPAKSDATKETPSKVGAAEAKSADEGKKGDEGKAGGEPPKIEGPRTEGAPKGDAAAAKLTPDEIAEIKKLPPADQELALKQVICPVSDEHLGEMGPPHKTTVSGRTVFLCCDNCEAKLKADPNKYFAKLDSRKETEKK